MFLIGEEMVEGSRIHMLMLMCKHSDRMWIVSHYSVKNKTKGRSWAGSGTARGGGRACSGPGLLSWAQWPLVEGAGVDRATGPANGSGAK